MGCGSSSRTPGGSPFSKHSILKINVGLGPPSRVATLELPPNMVKVCPGVDLSKRMVPPSPGPGGDLKSVITVKAGNVFEVFHPEHRSKAWYNVTMLQPWVVPADVTLQSVLENEHGAPLSLADFEAAAKEACNDDILRFWNDWQRLLVTRTVGQALAQANRMRKQYLLRDSPDSINVLDALRRKTADTIAAAESLFGLEDNEKGDSGPADSLCYHALGHTSAFKDASITDPVCLRNYQSPNGAEAGKEEAKNMLEMFSVLFQCWDELARLLQTGFYLQFVNKHFLKNADDAQQGHIWVCTLEYDCTHVIFDMSPERIGKRWRVHMDEGKDSEPLLTLSEELGLGHRIVNGVPVWAYVKQASTNALQTTFRPRPTDVFVAGYFDCGVSIFHVVVNALVNGGDVTTIDTSLPQYPAASMNRRGYAWLDTIDSWTHNRVFKDYSFPHSFPCVPGSKGQVVEAPTKVVLVCRNPFDAIFVHYEYSIGFRGAWPQYLAHVLEGKAISGDYFEFHEAWVEAQKEAPDQIRIVFMERFFQDPEGVLQELNTWLGSKLNEEQVCTVAQNSTCAVMEKFHRKNSFGCWYHDATWNADCYLKEYTPEMRRLMAQRVRDVWADKPEMMAWFGSAETCWRPLEEYDAAVPVG